MAQAILLVVAGTANVELQNADAVAYLRLASYYAQGRADLMVSGYWSPLVSWLITPWLIVGIPALAAARVAMGLSAVVFLAGTIAVFRSLRLPGFLQVTGAWIAALTSVYWSVQLLTPDLLLAGLLCLAFALTMERRWVEDWRIGALAGAAWALAYYAKSVAFPLAAIVTAGFGALHVASGAAWRHVVRALVVTLVTFAVVATPWVTALSLTYGTLTVSTSARINHALVGPPDVPRGHPLGRSFDRPAPGRVTSWEDPSRWTYAYWSPFERSDYARHQVDLIVRNARVALSLLSSFDALGLGLVAALTCLLVRRPWREALAAERWRWTVLPVVCLAAIYLPGYLNLLVQRYFYAAFPLLLAGAMGAAAWLPSRFGAGRWLKWSAVTIVAVSFVLPALAYLPPALIGLSHPASAAARELAQRLGASGVRGTIAGSGTLAAGRAGLYTAFFLDRPWFGDERTPTAEAYRRSGADIVVVARDAAVVAELDRTTDFQSLDTLLFSSPAHAADFPLKAYRRLGAGAQGPATVATREGVSH